MSSGYNPEATTTPTDAARAERTSASRKSNARPKARPPPQINKRSSFYTKMYTVIEARSIRNHLVQRPQIPGTASINLPKNEPVKPAYAKIPPTDDRSRSVKVNRPVQQQKPPTSNTTVRDRNCFGALNAQRLSVNG